MTSMHGYCTFCVLPIHGCATLACMQIDALALMHGCVNPACLRADRACGREGRRSQAAPWKGGRGSQQALAAPRPKRAAEGPCGRGHGFSICGARRHRAEPAAKEIWMVLGRVVAYYAQNCRWIHAPRIRGTRSFRIHQIRGPRGRGPRGRGSSPA